MHRYGMIMLLLIVLSGCYSPLEMEKAKAETAAQVALQQQAIAQQRMYEEETARFTILADAAKPVYWPFFVGLAVILLIVYMGHRATLAQVALLTGQQAEPVRLLPGSAEFERALLELAGERGVRPMRGNRGGYYLPTDDGGRERITALIER